ncbi:hypothetical protein LM602_06015 [Candidatus Acetothermia bacterium]|nr:hypothetical protein [Candidatus Acetothermia bacterium]MCI2432094.1 hypothetical protein [Candidatus Acetothermia bacterium]MCI2435901.1 hypothetical protein [Candidatus Acetothermia bacterium]
MGQIEALKNVSADTCQQLEFLKDVSQSASIPCESLQSVSKTTQGYHESIFHTIKDFYETKPWLLAIVVILTFISPFVGFWMQGISGALIGLVISVLTLVLGFLAIQKVRHEIFRI